MGLFDEGAEEEGHAGIVPFAPCCGAVDGVTAASFLPPAREGPHAPASFGGEGARGGEEKAGGAAYLLVLTTNAPAETPPVPLAVLALFSRLPLPLPCPPTPSSSHFCDMPPANPEDSARGTATRNPTPPSNFAPPSPRPLCPSDRTSSAVKPQK